MTLKQLAVLLFIAKNPNCTARLISKHTGLPYNSTTNILSQLSSKELGLTKMERDPDDIRTNRVRLTGVAKRIIS